MTGPGGREREKAEETAISTDACREVGPRERRGGTTGGVQAKETPARGGDTKSVIVGTKMPRLACLPTVGRTWVFMGRKQTLQALATQAPGKAALSARRLIVSVNI